LRFSIGKNDIFLYGKFYIKIYVPPEYSEGAEGGQGACPRRGAGAEPLTRSRSRALVGCRGKALEILKKILKTYFVHLCNDSKDLLSLNINHL